MSAGRGAARPAHRFRRRCTGLPVIHKGTLAQRGGPASHSAALGAWLQGRPYLKVVHCGLGLQVGADTGLHRVPHFLQRGLVRSEGGAVSVDGLAAEGAPLLAKQGLAGPSPLQLFLWKLDSSDPALELPPLCVPCRSWCSGLSKAWVATCDTGKPTVPRRTCPCCAAALLLMCKTAPRRLRASKRWRGAGEGPKKWGTGRQALPPSG